MPLQLKKLSLKKVKRVQLKYMGRTKETDPESKLDNTINTFHFKVLLFTLQPEAFHTHSSSYIFVNYTAITFLNIYFPFLTIVQQGLRFTKLLLRFSCIYRTNLNIDCINVVCYVSFQYSCTCF